MLMSSFENIRTVTVAARVLENNSLGRCGEGRWWGVSVSRQSLEAMARARADLLLIAAFLCLSGAESARILGLFPYKGASHFWVFKPLMEELARRGHQVTVASHVPRDSALANYTDISLKTPEDPPLGFAEIDLFETIETNLFTNYVGLYLLREGYERVLANPQILALTNTSFDLVITEMFNSDLFFGLTHKIGAPVIGFSSCDRMTWTSDALGEPIDLPYLRQIPGGHEADMGFFERLVSSMEKWLSRLYFRYVQFEDQRLAEKYLGPLPSLGEIAANTSMLFVNTHFTLFGHRAYPPNIVEVGGINVLEPKPLPTDLGRILNESESVIYFSMGSVLNSGSMPTEREQMFLKAFIASGRTVLWKTDKTFTPSHPRIITKSWFPQRDILAHPKVDLFIAHCGLLGLNEAVVSGVPLICIPMFGDQPDNAVYVAHSGIGLKLRYRTLSEETLKSSINEILNNKKYKQRALEISQAFKDRPLTPLDTAVFWTEYLLHHGPQPFYAPYKRMSLIQRLGIDVAAALVGIITTLTILLMFLLKKLYKRWSKVRKEKQS